MCAQYMPKTLAKTLTYILYHAPWEYGLFWDSDGTMPWKELYWALQEDPTLRFVRESHLRELKYLGIGMPAFLEGNRLHLQEGFPVPDYPLTNSPPERLFHACRRNHYPVVLQHGLSASSRPFVVLSKDREMALRLGKRRDKDPIVVEVLAGKASTEGTIFREAGPGLYLVESLPLEYLMCPPVRTEEMVRTGSKKKEEGKPAKSEMPLMPGSFLVAPQHFQDSVANQAQPPGGGGAKKKGIRGAEWKRDARKERHKREI
jgi:putative RNA 2'-phosphotransferase